MSSKFLFITALRGAWMQVDEAFLHKNYICYSFYFKSGKFWKLLWNQLRLFFWLLWHIWDARGIFIQFADYHSLIPSGIARGLGKKVIIGIGGYDAAYRPDLNYGAHLRWFRSWCVRKSCDWATVVLPVSEFSSGEIGQWTRGRIQVIYPGVNEAFWRPGESSRKMILTVCGCNDLITFNRKGIDLYIGVARLLPKYEFRIVGLTGNARWKVDLPLLPNLIYMGRQESGELRMLYQSAKIYCQLSRYEASGIALLEAMACGCFPIVLKRGGMPELVGGDGLVLDTEAPQIIADSIQGVMEYGTGYANPRQAILEGFTEKRRELELMELLMEELCL